MAIIQKNEFVKNIHDVSCTKFLKQDTENSKHFSAIN